MALRFRRRVKLFPGLTLNVSKRGLGLSAGVRGARVSLGSDGKVRRSVGIPGSGLSDVSVIGDVSGRRARGSRRGAAEVELPASSRRALRPVMLAQSGVFGVEAVSEHRFARNLELIMLRRNAFAELVIFAELVAEDSSVAVYIDGLQVGALSAGVAREWAERLDAMAAEGTVAVVGARLTGAGDRVAVSLDLPA
jgi:hypothetical protein